MRSHPKPRFAQVPLKEIRHLLSEKDAVATARRVTREKTTKAKPIDPALGREKATKHEPYIDPAISSKPTSMWGSFHS